MINKVIIISFIAILLTFLANIEDIRCQENFNMITNTYKSNYMERSQLQPPEGGGLKQGTPEGGSRGYREVAIVGTLFEVLGCDILHDHLVCNIAGRCSKVSASPQMATPKLLRQTTVFAQQLSRCFSLDRSHNFANGQLRRNRNEQVDMVFGDVPCDDFDIHGLAYFPNEVS